MYFITFIVAILLLIGFFQQTLLKHRILEIPHDEGLGLFLEVAPEVQTFHSRFEPTQALNSQRDWEELYDKNRKWGRSPPITGIILSFPVLFVQSKRSQNFDKPFNGKMFQNVHPLKVDIGIN